MTPAVHVSHAGRESILEVNGTSSGLCPDTADEDNLHIRELVLQRMSRHLAAAPAGAGAGAGAAAGAAPEPEAGA